MLLCTAFASPLTLFASQLDSLHHEDYYDVDIDVDEDDELVDTLGVAARPYTSEKLFGHPDWCQGSCTAAGRGLPAAGCLPRLTRVMCALLRFCVMVPGAAWAKCRKCSKKMQLVLQVRRATRTPRWFLLSIFCVHARVVGCMLCQCSHASARCTAPVRSHQLCGDNFDGFMFGDCGTAHLFQCDTHKEELGFGWACG